MFLLRAWSLLVPPFPQQVPNAGGHFVQIHQQLSEYQDSVLLKQLSDVYSLPNEFIARGKKGALLNNEINAFTPIASHDLCGSLPRQTCCCSVVCCNPQKVVAVKPCCGLLRTSLGFLLHPFRGRSHVKRHHMDREATCRDTEAPGMWLGVQL